MTSRNQIIFKFVPSILHAAVPFFCCLIHSIHKNIYKVNLIFFFCGTNLSRVEPIFKLYIATALVKRERENSKNHDDDDDDVKREVENLF